MFQPEWINRLDEIIAFRPLSSETLREVLDRMLQEANDQYLRHGISVELTDSAKEYMLHKAFEPRFGARPLRNQLLKLVEAPLADLLASGGIPEGSRVLVEATGIDKHGQALEFLYEAAPELLQQAQELRAAEVGRPNADGPQQPSVGISSDRGKYDRAYSRADRLSRPTCHTSARLRGRSNNTPE